MNLNPFRRGRKSKAEKLNEIKEQVKLAQEAVRTFHSEWGDWRGYFDGEKQEEIAKPLEELGLADDFVPTNFIFSSLENYISILMQAIQQPYVAEMGEQTGRAQAATAWLQTYSREKNLPGEMEMVYRNTVPIGNGALKVYWDPTEDDVVIRSIDPESIYPDPAAHSFKDASFVAIRNIYSEALAEQIFNGEGEVKKIDLGKATKVTTDAETGEIEDEPEKKSERIEVWEVYYDFGEHLIIYTADQVLFDGDNPTPNGRYPIFLFQLHKKTAKFWADGLVKYVYQLQDYINRTRTRIGIHEKYTVTPVWTLEGDQDSEIDLTPGSVNRLMPGAKLTPLRPPPLPAEVFTSLEKAQRDFDVITGTPEITKGIRPAGTTSGISLEVLQQAAQVRLTGPARNWTYVLRDMWQCVLEIMQRHYAEIRTMATMSGGEPEVVGIEPNSLSYLQPKVNEQGDLELDESGEPAQESVPLNLQVVMQAGGDLPMSPAAWADIGLRLKQLPNDEGRPGVVDDMLLLELLKLPGREDLLKRRQQQGAALQAGREQGQAMQQQAAAEQGATEQAALAEQQLAQLVPPEYMDLLRAVKSGSADPGLAEELLASLPEDARQLALQYLQPGAGMAVV